MNKKYPSNEISENSVLNFDFRFKTISARLLSVRPPHRFQSGKKRFRKRERRGEESKAENCFALCGRAPGPERVRQPEVVAAWKTLGAWRLGGDRQALSSSLLGSNERIRIETDIFGCISFVVSIARGDLMKTVVQKWGHGLALRIPKTMAEPIKVKEGTPVEIVEASGALLIKPTAAKPSLKELLAKVKPENLHGEIETGPFAGNEVW